MEINHHIAFNPHRLKGLLPKLEDTGIKFRTIDAGRGGQLISFDIYESDPKWRKILPYIGDALDIQNTIFSPAEILASKWVRLVPIFQSGYPQPESTWVTNPSNYKEFCSECGTYKQNEPFQIKREPDLKKYHFMSLYWTYAVFCVSSVIEEFGKGKVEGGNVWDVIIRKNKQPSQRVKQIYVPKVLKPGFINFENLKSKLCPKCGVTKYYPHMRGAMSYTLQVFTDLQEDFYLTNEWFGDGHFAYREIIVSNKVAKLVVENEWKGAQLKAIRLI